MTRIGFAYNQKPNAAPDRAGQSGTATSDDSVAEEPPSSASSATPALGTAVLSDAPDADDQFAEWDSPETIDAVAHAIRLAELGAGELLVTSMDGDGTQGGYDLALTRAIADAVSVPVIASGGVGTLDHLVEGVTQGHASAVLAASIFHFGTHSIAEAHDALRAAGLPARG